MPAKTYSSFDLSNLDDEEKLRAVLATLPIDQVHQIILAIGGVKKMGYGAVRVIVYENRLTSIEVTTKHEIEKGV